MALDKFIPEHTRPDLDQQAEIFMAWNEFGHYDVASTREGAIERLRDGSDGEHIRVKRFTTIVEVIQAVEDGGVL